MAKLFSLLSKEQVVTDEKKVIPAKDFSTLVESEKILKKVQIEAKNYRHEVSQECEILKDLSAKEGFDEGLLRFNKALLDLNHELKTLREEFKTKMLPITLKAAKKILGEELKLSPERITDIIMQALKPVAQHRKIKIYVNKADLDILENDKPKIKEILEQVDSFTIEERMDVEPGGCLIETEAGIINAQLENQWLALEKAFKSFIKK